MGRHFSLSYSADSLGMSRRWLNDYIGSGKILVEVIKGERRISESELERVRRLRQINKDFYVVWSDGKMFTNTGYASYLLGSGFSQDFLVDLVHQGEFQGRTMGNAIEIETHSLEKWVSHNYRWGQPFTLPIEPARQGALLRPSGGAR